VVLKVFYQMISTLQLVRMKAPRDRMSLRKDSRAAAF